MKKGKKKKKTPFKKNQRMQNTIPLKTLAVNMNLQNSA